MKKVIIITIFCLCFSIMLTSCSTAKNSQHSIIALEIGGSADSADGGVHSSEYPLWSPESLTRHADSTAPDTLTVEFDGVSYEGRYLYSAANGFNTYQTHYYEADNADFAVNAESMELETLLLFPDVPEPYGLSAGECKDIAVKAASEFIDVNEYELKINPGEYYHGYHFIRCIDGIETCDRLSVGIAVTGELATLSLNSVNVFQNIPQALSGETEEKTNVLQSQNALEVLEEKISQIYQNTDNIYYEIAGKTLVVLDDNELGMVYAVDVSIVSEADKDNNYSVGGSRLNILVKENV